jgi:hypothetical protein
MFPFAFGRDDVPVYREFPDIRRCDIPVSPSQSFRYLPEMHNAHIGVRGGATLKFNPDIPHSYDPNKSFVCDKCRKVYINSLKSDTRTELSVLSEYPRIARRSWQALELY